MSNRSESPVLENSPPPPEGQPTETTGLKRKEQSDGGQPISKRAAKKRRKAAAAPSEYDEIDEKLQINPAVARMDAALLADHVARQTKRFEKDLSAVELEDLRIPVSAIEDTTTWEGERIVQNLPSFLEQVTSKSREDLSHARKAKGSPHTLVITASGIRAADVTRALRVYHTKQATVAKLFAKHIKLKEAIESAKETRMNVGIGTPQRLIDLIENDAISTTAIERIIIDASHVDQKKRGIFDMREILLPLLKFLTLPKVKSRYEKQKDGQSSIKIIFF